VHHASLLEKLLVPALSKLSNFGPDGGIWMNTQRPEWNDANNALAGYGVSVVTLCHLRRYLGFVERILGDLGPARVSIAGDVAAWLRRIHAILGGHGTSRDPGGLDGRARKRLMDALGSAFSDYRTNVYTHGFSSTEEVPVGEVVAFCRTARDQVDRSIHGNRRPDGLYHSYHLLEFTPDGEGAVLHPLDEMLEGQVAVLGSGVVDEAEAVTVLAALFESRLYREDQRSFLLYPAKDLPGFLERNVAPEERVLAVPLLRGLLDAGERSLVERDTGGAYRFHGDLRTAGDVRAALDHLALDRRWTALVAQDRRAVLELFEAVFRHHAFTGRSGAMYAYEGIGCIYWHMVSKLLLATQEVALQAMRDGKPDRVREALITAYHRIRAGLGYEKTVTEYGAIPMDPYSHTPLHAGAQQPGMTGQAKEGILARFGELGVHVASGRVGFRPLLLRERELLRGASSFRFFDVNGRSRSLEVRDGTLAFTFCQVPVVYVATAGESWIRVTHSDGTSATRAGDRLDLPTSRALLSRDGAIDRIDVGVPEAVLRGF